MVVKWTFEDPNTDELYTFEINPNDDGLPGYRKNFSHQSTSAPDGKVLLFEGREEPRRGSFAGVTLSQAQHEAFIQWYEKRNQIIVTDDLGRSFTIVIESYEPKRRWARSHNWRHDYTMSYIVVEW
jgi:hypothetical protein